MKHPKNFSNIQGLSYGCNILDKKDSFYDSKRKRKTKMARKIKNFLLAKTKNKFTVTNRASCRKLATLDSKKYKIKALFRL